MARALAPRAWWYPGLMADKPSPPTLQTPGPSPETSFGFPAYEPPRAGPSSAIRKPGRSPVKNCASAKNGALLRLPDRLVHTDRLARLEVGQLGEDRGLDADQHLERAGRGTWYMNGGGKPRSME